MDINLKLKNYIESKGIKQSYLCKETGMTSDAISRIMQGKRKISAEELLSICDVIDVDPRAFMKTA